MNMKILHIVGKNLKDGNGITTAVPPLIKAQHKIKGVESKLAIITKKIESRCMDIDTYCFLNVNELENFIMNEYKPDIVVFHELYYYAYVQVYKVLKKINIPYIITPHCSLTIAAQQKSRVKKIVANKLFFKKFISLAESIAFLNEGEKNKSIYNKNHIICNNGIESKEINLSLKSSEKIKIIYLSRIDLYHKGLDYLLDAIKQIDINLFEKYQFEIELYGSGNKKDTEYVTNYINNLKNKYVKFNGPIYGKEKEKLLNKSNILVLTSRLEGMPMAILESLTYGNPCIVTAGTNMDKVICEYNAGWTTDSNPNKIADTIITAVKMYRENKQVYIDNSLNLAIERYDWNKIALRSIEDYKKLLEKYNRGNKI